MELFDRLHEQIDTVRLPLFAVTVTAAAHINTPLIVLLHWHGFRRATPLVLPGVDISSRPVPPSTITLNLQWRSFETVDLLVLDAAWQLGAWDVERVEQRSCNVIGASAAEALACRQAFGFYEADASNRAAILKARRLRFIMDHLTDKNGCPQGSGCVSRSVARPPGAASEQHTMCPSPVTKAVAQPSAILNPRGTR